MANTWNQALTTWGQNAWGEQADVNLTLTGLSATTSVGSVDAYVQPGWGTLEWGYNGWGSVDEAVVRPSGVSATTSVGAITPADVMGLTGVSATTSIGTPTLDISVSVSLTGVSATTSVGSLNVEIGVPLTGVSATSAVGTPTARSYNTTALTGVSATTNEGSITITSNPTVQPSGGFSNNFTRFSYSWYRSSFNRGRRYIKHRKYYYFDLYERRINGSISNHFFWKSWNSALSRH